MEQKMYDFVICLISWKVTLVSIIPSYIRGSVCASEYQVYECHCGGGGVGWRERDPTLEARLSVLHPPRLRVV